MNEVQLPDWVINNPEFRERTREIEEREIHFNPRPPENPIVKFVIGFIIGVTIAIIILAML